MNVPCPVPLKDPWSPAGYEVVEMADVPQEKPPQDRPPPGRGKRAPSSAAGYHVVQVAEEKSAALVRALSPGIHPWQKRRPKKGQPLFDWCPVTVLGAFLLLLPVGFALLLVHLALMFRGYVARREFLGDGEFDADAAKL